MAGTMFTKTEESTSSSKRILGMRSQPVSRAPEANGPEKRSAAVSRMNSAGSYTPSSKKDSDEHT